MPLYSIAKLIIFLYTTYFYTFFSISLLFWIFSVQIFLPNCQPLTVWHGFRYLADRKFNSNNKIFSIMNIKPLGDRVLVLPAPAEEKIGGIIIPDTAKEKPLHGTIKAVGQGTKDEEMVLKAGDEVLYGKYSGTELKFEGEKYLMMRQSDVLAVIEK